MTRSIGAPGGLIALAHESEACRIKGEAFRKELAALLNRYSMENGSDTPDFLLADYLIEALRALDAAILAREKWYGRSPSSPSAASHADNKEKS